MKSKLLRSVCFACGVFLSLLSAEAQDVKALSDLSEQHRRQGDHDRADDLFEQALAAADRSRNLDAKVYLLLDAAFRSHMASDYEKASIHLENALADAHAMDDGNPQKPIAETMVLVMLSEVYLRLGRLESAREKALAGQALARRSNFPEAEVLGRMMGEFVRLTEDPKTDLTTLRGLLSGLVGALSPSDSATVRRSTGQVEGTFRDFSAILDLAEGQETQPQPGDSGPAVPRRPAHSPEASLIEEMATQRRAYEALQASELDRAIELFEQVRRQAAARGQKDVESVMLTAITICYVRMGRTDLAAKKATEAVDASDAVLSEIKVDDFVATGLSGDRLDIYQLAIALSAQLGKAAEAFDLAERARSRALLHQLGNQRLSAFDVDPKLKDELESLRMEILKLENEPFADDGLKEKRARYDELLIRAKLTHPEYAGLKKVEPVGVETLQKELLPADTTLIAYYILGPRVLVWMVDRQRVQMMPLELPESDRAELSCFVERLDRASRGTEGKAVCAAKEGLEEKYFDRLMGPILPHIAHDRLILVPHGVLHRVPFAALRSPRDKSLLELKTLSYAPSVGALRFLDAKKTPFEGRALVLGDPELQGAMKPLPGARREAQSVAALFGTRPWLGSEATERRVRQAAGGIDVLHLAAHGVYRPTAPRFSHIALASGDGEDGRLEVEEVLGELDLRGVDLVTLSACRTAAGEPSEGDDILGLTRAFLYAGSPAVVSTLWRVDDRATEFLMKAFYGFLKSGQTYGDALRRAQLETSSRPGWSDPHFWAAFVLTGDADMRWQTTGSS